MKIKLKLIIITLISTLLVSGCGYRHFKNRSTKAVTRQESIALAKKSDGPITVFVHGTLPIGANLVIRAFDSPLGLVPATSLHKFIHGKIPHYFKQHDPCRYPLDSFFVYGWNGALSFAARRKAAHDLYHLLKAFEHRPITVIGHSHGGNVALNLAEVAKMHNDTTFKIDRLVLLAAPVMAATAHYVNSPVFNKIYSFYSLGDTTQAKDPQRLYVEMRNFPGPVPLFSTRKFGPAPKVTERRVLHCKRNIQHLDFILLPFIKVLPSILDLLEKNPSVHEQNPCYELSVNIPRKVCDPIEQLIKPLKQPNKHC